MAVHLDQQQRLHFARQADLGEILHAVDGRLVHDLEGGGDDPCGNDLGDRLAGRADVPEIGQKRPLVLRRIDQPDRDLGDDPQGPLAAHQEIPQGVPGHILDALVSGDKFRTVVEQTGKRHHIVPGDPVFETPQTARILRHIAAERRYVLRSGIGRIEQAARRHRVEELGRDHPGFRRRRQIFFIDFQNPVHPREAQDHPARRRGAAPGEARGRAARGDGKPFLTADLQGGFQPLAVFRKDGHLRKAFDFRRCIIAQDEQILPLVVNVLGADFPTKMIDHIFADHGMPLTM